jgi:protein ImuB
MPIVCVRLPRFELVIAAGGASALAGSPLALAGGGGSGAGRRGSERAGEGRGRARGGARGVGDQRLGEVSGAAEAFGVVPGMAIGEALARCPELALIAPDPIGVAHEWEQAIVALEGIGAGVESESAGLAYFRADGLIGLYAGLEGVLGATRVALERPARLGVAPTRFCALAASMRARARRAALVTVQGGDATAVTRRYLAPMAVALLRHRADTSELVSPLERLGLRRLGDIAALSRDAMADRFGEPGLLALDLACGHDTPLRPRVAAEDLQETLQLPESASGTMLQRALQMLIDRLLAHPRRRGRTLRAVVIAARLAGGGTWREQVVFREALADPRRMWLALSMRLELLPAPADSLALRVERFGPPGGDQHSLLDEGREARMRRLYEAVRQVRAVAGPYGALRALDMDPDSRVPERQVMLTPFEG